MNLPPPVRCRDNLQFAILNFHSALSHRSLTQLKNKHTLSPYFSHP